MEQSTSLPMLPPSSGPSNPLRPSSAKDWETQRAKIEHLYATEGRPLKEVRQIMLNEGFQATERQYKTRIQRWSLDKNVKSSEMDFMIRKQAQRKGAPVPKHTAFHVRGRPIKPEKITRTMKRKKVSEAELAQTPGSVADTPSDISYYTPSAAGPTTPHAFSEEQSVGHSPVPFPNSQVSPESVRSPPPMFAQQSPAALSSLPAFYTALCSPGRNFTGRIPAPLPESVGSIPNVFAGRSQPASANSPPFHKIVDPRVHEAAISSPAPSPYSEANPKSSRPPPDSSIHTTTSWGPALPPNSASDPGPSRSPLGMSIVQSSASFSASPLSFLRPSLAYFGGPRSPGQPFNFRAANEEHDSVIYQSMGLLKEAERLLRLEAQCSGGLIGENHPDTLMTISNLAEILRKQGKYEKADEMQRLALEGSEKALGPEHPNTLTSVSNLASVLESQGKYEAAEAMNRRALEGKEKALGLEHPEMLTSVSNLASVLKSQGKYEAAEAMNRRALEGYEKALGPEHPNTLTSVSNLASVLKNQGKYEAAEVMNRRALEGREKALGLGHPDTLTSAYCLAYLLHQRKRCDEAIPLYIRACGGLENVFGALIFGPRPV